MFQTVLSKPSSAALSRGTMNDSNGDRLSTRSDPGCQARTTLCLLLGLPSDPSHSQPPVDTAHGTSPTMSLGSRAVPRGEEATITHSKPDSDWPAPLAFVHTKQELSKGKTLTCNAENSKSNRPHAHRSNDDKHSISCLHRALKFPSFSNCNLMGSVKGKKLQDPQPAAPE